MEILQQNQDNIIVLSVQGRVDALSAPELEKILLDLIAADERRLLVDFSRVKYISSAGLRVFLIAMKQLKPVQGKLVLCELDQYVKEVFDISGMTQLFKIFPGREEAIRELQ